MNLIAYMTIFLSFGMIACIKPTEGSAELKWGHLNKEQQFSDFWMINIPPNSNIEVCGDADLQAPGVAAVKKWAAPIGRDKYLNVATCGGVPAPKFTLLMQRENCEGTAYALIEQRKVQICKDGIDELFTAEKTLLHEMGHLWGMCDTYEPSIELCDKSTITGTSDSVMKTSLYTELVADDIAGIQALAKRNDFSANKMWEDFLATESNKPAQEAAALFLAIEDLTGDLVTVHASSPTSVVRVGLCLGDKNFCLGSTANFMPLAIGKKESNRVFYKSGSSVSLQSGKSYTLVGWDDKNSVAGAIEVLLARK